MCGSRPLSPPCFPSCLFMLPREPRAGLRTGPGGQVPVLDTGAVPWGRDTASWAATEVSCKTLDALEPGQCRSWCTCHRRVCWHGLARRGILVGLCRASLPASCSSGFWFLWQLGFQDLGKSGLGGGAGGSGGMSWAGPSLPRSVFQSRRGGQRVAPGRPRGEGAEEPWACPSPIAREGGLCTGPASRTECRKRAEATREPARRWLWGQLVVRTQVPRGGRGPGVNPDSVRSEGPAATLSGWCPGDWRAGP